MVTVEDGDRSVASRAFLQRSRGTPRKTATRSTRRDAWPRARSDTWRMALLISSPFLVLVCRSRLRGRARRVAWRRRRTTFLVRVELLGALNASTDVRIDAQIDEVLRVFRYRDALRAACIDELTVDEATLDARRVIVFEALARRRNVFKLGQLGTGCTCAIVADVEAVVGGARCAASLGCDTSRSCTSCRSIRLERVTRVPHTKCVFVARLAKHLSVAAWLVRANAATDQAAAMRERSERARFNACNIACARNADHLARVFELRRDVRRSALRSQRLYAAYSSHRLVRR